MKGRLILITFESFEDNTCVSQLTRRKSCSSLS